MKIAVTGSNGFIGSNLLPVLISRGYRVVALTEPGLRPAIHGVDCFSVDVSSGEGLANCLKDVEGVVHLAARNHILKETEKDPLSAYCRVNVEGTRNVIRAAVQAGAGWFIHFSSVKAMGEGGEAVLDEDSPCKPSTPYGISKLESEEAVRRVAEESGIRAVIFRLPMTYGPGNLGNLPRMIRWADRGLPFPLVQPDNLRSMVYVGNVVAAVIAVLESLCSGKMKQGTYIVKDETDYSTRTIYSSICRELGKSPRFLPLPALLGRFAGAISEDFRKVTSSLPGEFREDPGGDRVRPAGFRGRGYRKDGAVVQAFGPITFGFAALSLAISAAGVWGFHPHRGTRRSDGRTQRAQFPFPADAEDGGRADGRGGGAGIRWVGIPCAGRSERSNGTSVHVPVRSSHVPPRFLRRPAESLPPVPVPGPVRFGFVVIGFPRAPSSGCFLLELGVAQMDMGRSRRVLGRLDAQPVQLHGRDRRACGGGGGRGVLLLLPGLRLVRPVRLGGREPDRSGGFDGVPRAQLAPGEDLHGGWG